WMASSIPGRPSGVRVSDLAIFPWHSGALLPAVALERMTIERLTLALVAAAAAVPQLAAISPGTIAVESPPPPSGKRHGDRGSRLSRQACAASPSGSSATSP